MAVGLEKTRSIFERLMPFIRQISAVPTGRWIAEGVAAGRSSARPEGWQMIGLVYGSLRKISYDFPP